jgi:hypothetical protein
MRQGRAHMALNIVQPPTTEASLCCIIERGFDSDHTVLRIIFELMAHFSFISLKRN